MLKPCCRNLIIIVQDCRSVLQSGFIFQQDGAPSCTHGKAGSRLDYYCSEFIGKDEWPPNSPDLNPLDYHVWGAMLECYKSSQPSRRTSMSSRKFCSWYGTSCHKTRSTKPYWASRIDFGLVWKLVWKLENTLKWTTCDILVFVITVNVSWQWKLQVAVDYSMQNWKYSIEYLYSQNFGAEKSKIILKKSES